MACGGSSSGGATTPNPCGGDPCGGDPCGGDPCGAAGDAMGTGADYATAYQKLNTEKFVSETHGNRMVDVYVNDIGAAAYFDADAEVPVGTIIVKPSFAKDGSAGPVFVMEKKEAGFSPDHGDWNYELYNPTAGNYIGKTPDKKVDFCSGCHDNYDRELGGIPDAKRVSL